MRAAIAERYGWSFAQIDDMTFDQIASALRGTRRATTGIALGGGLDDLGAVGARASEIARNWRKYVVGLEGY